MRQLISRRVEREMIKDFCLGFFQNKGKLLRAAGCIHLGNLLIQGKAEIFPKSVASGSTSHK